MKVADFRWFIRRWSPRHLVYRARLPARRRRRRIESEDVCRPFTKAKGAAPTAGPALVFGEFGGTHGLGRAAAYDVELLRKRHAHVQTVDIGPYLTGDLVAPPVIEWPIENLYLFCQPDTYRTVFRLLSPDKVSNAYRVGRWVWETPVFPQEWQFAEQLVHEVWAPSEFCAATFRKAIDAPVKILPHLVSEPPETSIDMRTRLGIHPDAFMGLAIMDIRACPARKNPWAHVLAWQQAFGADSDAVLVMKLRVNKRTRVVLEELRELVAGATNVLLICDEMNHVEIAALHRAVDVYVSLHRAEGFGLTMYEALLLGKPVIATDFSANAEYGPRFPQYMGVRYSLEPYRDWMGSYQAKQFSWAEVDCRHAAELLVKARQNHAACRSLESNFDRSKIADAAQL